MSAKTLSTLAEDYLYSINPLAKRIGEDVAATKDAYEGLWNTLSLEERNQALDETIIQPEVALKYASKKLDSSTKEFPDYYPKLRIQTGMKYMIDETGSTLRWKDEHSAPFSFMTQSQMNLNCLDQNVDTNAKNITSYISDTSHYANSCNIIRNHDDSLEDNYSPPSSQISFYQTENYSDTIFSTEDCSTLRSSCIDSEASEGIFAKLINKTSLLKIQQNSSDDDMENLVPQKSLRMTVKVGSDKNQMNINFGGHLKSSDIESAALLDTPSSYSSYQSSQLNQDPEIPKTGFEFLDNW